MTEDPGSSSSATTERSYCISSTCQTPRELAHCDLKASPPGEGKSSKYSQGCRWSSLAVWAPVLFSRVRKCHNYVEEVVLYFVPTVFRMGKKNSQFISVYTGAEVMNYMRICLRQFHWRKFIECLLCGWKTHAERYASLSRQLSWTQLSTGLQLQFFSFLKKINFVILEIPHK